jgi:putative hydrolase of HD superfamily
MDLGRYHHMHLFKRRSVAEHSWYVSQLAYALARWENTKFKDIKVNMEKVLTLATTHDNNEVYTGDVISTLKVLSPTLKEELSSVEEKLVWTKILPMLPVSWRSDFFEMFKEIRDKESHEAKLVKVADILDRVFESMEEIKLGNKEHMLNVLSSDVDTLFGFSKKYKSVAYFMKYCFRDIGVYDYLAEEQIKYLEDLDFSMYF